MRTLLFHVTPIRNLESIRKLGLIPEMAKGAKRVWLVTRSKIKWADAHVKRRHSTRRVCVLFVGSPRGIKFYRARRGVYFTYDSVQTFDEKML